MTIAQLQAGHREALERFVGALPEGDLTFIEEDLRDPAVVEEWVRGGGRAQRWVALDDDGTVVGLVALVPLLSWCSHVGELRMVVDPEHRGRGIGRALGRHALLQAAESKLRKVVVEVVAEQEAAVRMFFDLGFEGEALLRDHIRDRSGALRDLLVLALFLDEHWSAMASVGVQDEVS
jgi:L-amino acid N-acyltransferase YncA